MHNKTILTFNIIAAILPQQKPGWPNPRIEINAVCSFVIFLSVNGHCFNKLKRKDTEDTLSLLSIEDEKRKMQSQNQNLSIDPIRLDVRGVPVRPENNKII